MKRFVALATVVALGCATSVWAADLNVRVVSGGAASVNVSPSATVDYEVWGVLTSDSDNMGLALFGFDLELLDGSSAHAGDLDAAVTAAAAPMNNFAMDLGITNPDGPCPPACGYGGTIIGGVLRQIGGGQNTINNDIGNAPYPIGTVITGVAHTEVLLVAGSLTAPAADGTYHLTLSELFANVITVEQTTFWSVGTAGVETIDNLEIIVSEVTSCLVDSTFPPSCAVDARQPSAPNGDAPAGWDSIDINYADASCANALASGDVVVTVIPNDVPAPVVLDAVAVGATATLSLDAAIPVGHWTCFEIGGQSTCVGYLPGDVNGDMTAAPPDILSVIDNLNGVVNPPMEMWQCDVDRSDSCEPPDILRVIDLLNGAGVYDAWLNVSLPMLEPCSGN